MNQIFSFNWVPSFLTRTKTNESTHPTHPTFTVEKRYDDGSEKRHLNIGDVNFYYDESIDRLIIDCLSTFCCIKGVKTLAIGCEPHASHSTTKDQIKTTIYADGNVATAIFFSVDASMTDDDEKLKEACKSIKNSILHLIW